MHSAIKRDIINLQIQRIPSSNPLHQIIKIVRKMGCDLEIRLKSFTLTLFLQLVFIYSIFLIGLVIWMRRISLIIKIW